MEHKIEKRKHKHHIVPKHSGGTDDPSNLVELTIEEHAETHRQLYLEHGKWQDKVAWLGLLKNIEDAEIQRLKQSLGGREGGKKLRGVAKTKEHRQKMSEAHKGKPSNFKGQKHSLETIEKMKRPLTPEHCSNLKGKSGKWIRTPETKEKYRLAAIERWRRRQELEKKVIE